MASPDLPLMPIRALCDGLRDWLREPGEGRRRAVAIALTIAVHLLLALLLLNLAPASVRKPFSSVLSTFIVAPDGGEAKRTPVQRQPQQRERARAARPAPPRPTPPTPDVPLPEYLRMTRDQFAATDLATLPRSAAPGDASDDHATATADSRNPAGLGSESDGSQISNAVWVRMPTRAEMAPYLPPVPVGSWGEIVCRAIPNNRVENCQLLGESPSGSRFATGLRRAAWQFLIYPPRVGGKAIVGGQICIHYEITDRPGDDEAKHCS